jgi:hypothetical protein
MLEQEGPVIKKPSNVERALLEFIDVDSRAIGSGLQEMYYRMGSMESDNNPNAAAKESSAKGVYQYLTDNAKDGKNSSFEVALNRLSRAFKKAGEEVPEWVAEAKKHKDPRKLTRDQSNEMLLADLVLTPKKSRKYLQDFLVKRDDQALANLYAEVHHTDTKQNDNVEKRMQERLGAAPSGETNASKLVADTMARGSNIRPGSL